MRPRNNSRPILSPPIIVTLVLLVMIMPYVESPCPAQSVFRERLRQRLGQVNQPQSFDLQRTRIANLDVAVWEPAIYPTHGAPLVIFSHGFHGTNTQSIFLMKALSNAGYLVIAPNHKDALGHGLGLSKPDERFSDTGSWTDKTFRNRAEDIKNLLNGLHQDARWSNRINWSKLVLAGHSLGGYTVLGLAGAWPSWRINGVKAVLALSPYCQPFIKNRSLRNLHVPVMYQSGTRDIGVAPSIGRTDGAYDQTPPPTFYIVFDKASHFAFCGLNRDQHQLDLINFYCVTFLNKYVNKDESAKPQQRLSGVAFLKSK